MELAALLLTEGASNRRRSVRRTLRLDVQTYRPGAATAATVHDLSETGLTIETVAPLVPGEWLFVELPEIGATPAEVKWTRDALAGCQFLMPVASSAISAALLRAPANAHHSVESYAPAPQQDLRGSQESFGTYAVLIICLLMAVCAVVIFGLAISNYSAWRG